MLDASAQYPFLLTDEFDDVGEPRKDDTLIGWWSTYIPGVLYVSGSLQFLLGSVMLFPLAKLAVPGLWLFITGSIVYGMGLCWDMRNASRKRDRSIPGSPFLFVFSRPGRIYAVELLGSIAFGVGCYLFLLPDMRGDEAVDLFVAGSVLFVAAGVDGIVASTRAAQLAWLRSSSALDAQQLGVAAERLHDVPKARTYATPRLSRKEYATCDE